MSKKFSANKVAKKLDTQDLLKIKEKMISKIKMDDKEIRDKTTQYLFLFCFILSFFKLLFS